MINQIKKNGIEKYCPPAISIIRGKREPNDTSMSYVVGNICSNGDVW